MSVDAADVFRASTGDGIAVRTSGAISLCIVNNMPDAVLGTTERQFRDLIAVAARGRQVDVRFFSLPDHRRSDATKDYIHRHYHDISTLWTSQCDGLIVTGSEPRAPSLRQEPFWPALSQLIEWAQSNSTSAVWLCLAAHAAVLHLSGIERQPLPRKLFGLFDCVRATEHRLLAGCASRWVVPHSGHNQLSENDLVSGDYTVLSKSPAAGVDIFVKQSDDRSRFVFMQGHLEYEAGSLLEEYRREIARFRAGKRSIYPDLPYCYFTQSIEQELVAIQQKIIAYDDPGSVDAVLATAATQLAHSWHLPAAGIYANWLSDLARSKSLAAAQRSIPDAATLSA